MLEFLGFLALISIIFGVSMGQAFGGLVSVFIWLYIISVVILFFEKLFEKIKTPEPEYKREERLKKLEEQKKAQEAKKWENKTTGEKASVIICAVVIGVVLGCAIGFTILAH